MLIVNAAASGLYLAALVLIADLASWRLNELYSHLMAVDKLAILVAATITAGLMGFLAYPRTSEASSKKHLLDLLGIYGILTLVVLIVFLFNMAEFKQATLLSVIRSILHMSYIIYSGFILLLTILGCMKVMWDGIINMIRNG